MTKNKHQNESDYQLHRKFHAISDCNQVLLRSDDEQSLLEDICRIICEDAGYRMAWVGYAENNAAKTVIPRAWAGAENGFLKQIKPTWSESPDSRCPCSNAIRTGNTTYIQDLSVEDSASTWLKSAIAHGFRSVIALPLKNDNNSAFGVLSIYSDRPDTFIKGEVELLGELASDLAFGINSLRLKAERAKADQQLAASEQLFRTLVENSPDHIARYDLDLRRVYINPALQKMFSVEADQLLGETSLISSPLVDPEQYMSNLRRVIETATEYYDEVRAYQDMDGQVHWAGMRFAPEFGPDGKVASVLVISQDISARKWAEKERDEHLVFLESLDRVNRVLQGEGDLKRIMARVLDEVLDIFGCDRAYLVYPCDPDAPSWSVPIESCRPEYPGAGRQGQLKMDEYIGQVMAKLLDSDGPARLGPGAEHPVPRELFEQFNIRSNMAMALYPRVDKPWQFGIHQCSHDRTWTDQETRLFEEIGHRLSDGLNSLLIARDLRESEERYRLVFESSPLPIQEYDYSAVKKRLDELQQISGGGVEGYLLSHPEVVRECAGMARIINVNQASVALHEARSKQEAIKGLLGIFTPESYDAFRSLLVGLAQGQKELLLEGVIQTLTGRLQKVNVYVSVCHGYEQSLGKLLVSLIDITERKRSEERLRLAASVFASSQEGILISDAENRIIDINPAFTKMTGYTRDESIGRNPGFLSAGRQPPEFYADMWRAIETDGEWQGEVWNKRKSGEVYAELLSIVAVKDENGCLQHYVGAFTDISILKEHEAELDHIAHYDMLTSVPNRRLLSDRLDQAIARCKRNGKSLAICYLDLDGFKQINDQFRHEGGDRMLVEIARRLEWISRSDDTVARLGGDEFVLLWNDIVTEADCTHALDRVLSKVSEPMEIDGEDVSVSVSIGVTIYPDDNADADTLLRHADQAMYSAKRFGKNHYQMFDIRLERQITSQFEFLSKVEHGLDDEQFELYFQPKVDCVAGTIQGCEALLRWKDPVLGVVGPSEFLPVIEDESLAFRVGRWVIDHVLIQARIWNDMGICMPISINLFPCHLKSQSFIADLRDAISNYWPELPKGRLLMEIVESSDLEELEPIERIIRECLDMGIGFSLDDFGTGYSSLVYLRRLSIEELKIDRTFVRDMLNDPDDMAIVEGVIALGRAFGLRVVAEGVETLEQAQYLKRLGCTIVQGFGLGLPMPSEAFEEWYTEFMLNGMERCR